jgi:hypothetical protein
MEKIHYHGKATLDTDGTITFRPTVPAAAPGEYDVDIEMDIRVQEEIRQAVKKPFSFRDLPKVSIPITGTFRREEIYDDDGRC